MTLKAVGDTASEEAISILREAIEKIKEGGMSSVIVISSTPTVREVSLRYSSSLSIVNSIGLLEVAKSIQLERME